jgi:hypothetical protein
LENVDVFQMQNFTQIKETNVGRWYHFWYYVGMRCVKEGNNLVVAEAKKVYNKQAKSTMDKKGVLPRVVTTPQAVHLPDNFLMGGMADPLAKDDQAYFSTTLEEEIEQCINFTSF